MVSFFRAHSTLVKNMYKYTPNLVAAELPLVFSKTLFFSIVLICKITTSKTGRNIVTFISREILASICLSSQCMCKFTPKRVVNLLVI